MLKKIGIATVAVVAGLVLLTKTNFGSYACLGWQKIKSAAQKAVPVEVEIERLKAEVAKLRPTPKLLSDIARREADIKELEKDVAGIRTAMAARHKNISALADAVQQVDQSDKSREKQARDLDREIKLYDSQEGTLKSKEATLVAKQEALKAAFNHLSTMKQVREELEAELARLEAEHQVLKNEQARNEFNFDSSDLGRIKKSVSALRQRLNEDARVNELMKKYGPDMIGGDEKKAADVDVESVLKRAERFGKSDKIN